VGKVEHPSPPAYDDEARAAVAARCTVRGTSAATAAAATGAKRLSVPAAGRDGRVTAATAATAVNNRILPEHEAMANRLG
jgi:hypothetical protein